MSSSPSPLARALLALALPLLLVGCVTGERGLYAANGVGDIIETTPVRTEWPDVLQEACGPPGPSDLELLRAPYVQSVEPREALVLWRSDAAPTEAVRVWLAAEPEETERTFEGEDGFEAWAPDEARLTRLEPSATHCYELTRDGETVAGPFAFRTAPEGDEAPVDLVALGDSGTAWDEQHAVAAQMRTVPSELILHTGDVAYDSGTPAQIEATVFGVYEDLFASVPFYPSLGNHDLETRDGAPYRAAFALPEVDDPEGVERWYSFDWGPLHVAVLDSTSDLDPQVAWLDRDLDRTDLPWVIVVMHHPPYSSGRHGSSRSRREALAPVLAEHRVPLVLTGHDHHYERTIPIDGTTYVVTGGGGRQISAVSPRDFTAHADSVHHFLYLRIEGRRLRMYAIDAQGTVFDSVEIVSER